jgi:hypothetical protein
VVTMTSHKEWAEQLAAGLRKKQHNEALRTQTKLSDEERRRALAPDTWNKLRGEINDAVAALNDTGISERRLVATNKGQHDISVEIVGTPHVITLIYNSHFYRITAHQKTKTEFNFIIVGEETGWGSSEGAFANPVLARWVVGELKSHFST